MSQNCNNRGWIKSKTKTFSKQILSNPHFQPMWGQNEMTLLTEVKKLHIVPIVAAGMWMGRNLHWKSENVWNQMQQEMVWAPLCNYAPLPIWQDIFLLLQVSLPCTSVKTVTGSLQPYNINYMQLKAAQTTYAAYVTHATIIISRSVPTSPDILFGSIRSSWSYHVPL